MLSVNKPLDGLTDSGKFKINPVDEPIEVTLNDFEKISYISKGGFGSVWKTKYRGELELYVAQKISILKNGHKRQQESYRLEGETVTSEPWYRELSFHQISNHKHIVRLHGYIAIIGEIFSQDHNRLKQLHLFLELMTCSFREILHCTWPHDGNFKSTAFKRDGVISVEPLKGFLRHVCSGLIYLHDNKYMHRDLKPGNILLKAEDGIKTAVVKLTDFGTIKDYQDTTQGRDNMLHSADPGTTKYSAPEVLSNDRKYDTSCDMWSVGITSLQLLAGYHPVVTEDERKKYSSSKSSNTIYCRTISSDDIFTDLPAKMGLEEDLADILAQCLERDPEKRPSAEDVLKFLGGEQDDGRLLYEWFRSELGIYEDTLKRLRDQH